MKFSTGECKVLLHWGVTEEQTVNNLTVSWQCSLVAPEAKAFLAGEGRWSFLVTLSTDEDPSGVLDSLVLEGYKLSGAALAWDCVWEAERAGTCRREEEKSWGRSWHLAGGNVGGGARLFSVAFSDRTKWTLVRDSICPQGNTFILRGWSDTRTGFLESLRSCYPWILIAWLDFVQSNLLQLTTCEQQCWTTWCWEVSCWDGKLHKEPCKSIWLGQVFNDHADLKYSLFSKAKLYTHEEEGRARSYLKPSVLRVNVG